MNYEYTYLWWEGSTTSTVGANVGNTTPPIGEEVIDKINSLAAEGWEIDQITSAPLMTSWISPKGQVGMSGVTDTVHYLTILRRPRVE
ncbi:MAG: hypothetical protein ACLFRT_09510 [Actinomycetota bacterium]